MPAEAWVRTRPATARRWLMVATVATVAVSIVGAACAADDELSVPRPTVPTVTSMPEPTAAAATPATDGAAPASGQAQDLQPADPPRTGEPESSGAPEIEAALEAVAPAAGTPEAAEAGAVAPESLDPTSAPVSIRPDGNMFAADIELLPVLTLQEPIDMAVLALWITLASG